MDSRVDEATTLGPVVAGTDGSAHATAAVLWAAAEATIRRQSLHIVHAADTDARAGQVGADTLRLITDSARTVLEEVLAEVSKRFPDLQVTTELSPGNATDSLLEAVGTDGTIVVGSRGLGGFAALLVGSVSLRVAARAKGPVIVVRDVTEPTATGVVLAAVRDERDVDALRFAALTAREHKASLRVLSAWLFLQNVGSMATMVDDVTAIAEAETHATTRIVEPFRREFPDLSITQDVVRATSVAEILVEASAQADLLVVSARRRSHAVGSSLGRVTHAVLHHAHCPVAVVPHT